MNDRLAPHNQEAEEAVLGAVLLDNAILAELTDIKADAFYILRHAWLWQAMQALHERGEGIDNLSLSSEMATRGQLEDIGGNAFITHLINACPSALYAVDTYAPILKRKSLRRQLLSVASRIANDATSPELDEEEMLHNSEKLIFEIAANQRPDKGEWIGAIAAKVMDGVIERLENPDLPGGVPTGFSEIDEITNGLQDTDLLILAARPGMGKSSLAMNIAVNAAKQGIPVAFFSLEMSKEQLVQRIIAAETGINSAAIKSGRLNEQQTHLFLAALDRVSRLPIFIDDDPSWNIISLKSECRRLVASEGVGLIVVDYLQLLEGKRGGSNPENRVQEVSFISRHLKIIAKELKVPVLALSQLSRALEARADKRPMLSDLRESGSIEQDADIVMFIYRDDMYNENSERPNQADILFAKHRNGSTGVATLHFNKALTLFSNLKHEIIHTNEAVYRG